MSEVQIKPVGGGGVGSGVGGGFMDWVSTHVAQYQPDKENLWSNIVLDVYFMWKEDRP